MVSLKTFFAGKVDPEKAPNLNAASEQTEDLNPAVSADSDFNALEIAAHAQQKIEHELTKWQAMKTYPKATMWVVFMVWMMVLTGYENQASGIVLSIPQFRQDFGHKYENEYVLDATWQSAISGVPTAVMSISGFGVSYFCDKFGRKKIMIAALLFTIPAIAVEFVSTTIGVFLAGKTMNALSLGCFNTLCISYVSEIAPMALRGWSAAACSLSLCIGPFICYLINNTTATYTSRMAYRGVFIPQWIFSVTCLIIAPFMPESPYYYITKNKDAEAQKSLSKLYNPTQAQQQYAIMKVTYEELRLITQSTTYLDCFKKKEIKRTLLVMFAQWMQAMCGVTFIGSYSTYYYQLAGFSTQHSYQLSCGAQALSVSGVIASWFIIDRFGRRPLMFFGMSSLTILNLIVAASGTATHNPTAMTVASAFIAMYNFFYNIAIGPLPYIMGAEISSVSLRAKTLSFGMITNNSFQCMWSFVLPYMFNPDQANMGSKINFIFTGMSFMSLFVFYFFQPETAGRSFEEIDELYNSKVPLRKWKNHKTEKQHASEASYGQLKQEVSHVEFADEDDLA